MDLAMATKVQEARDEAIAEFSRKRAEADESWGAALSAKREREEQRGSDYLRWEEFPSELKGQFMAALALEGQVTKALRVAGQASQDSEDAWKLYTAAD